MTQCERMWVSGAECSNLCGWWRRSWGGQFVCPRCGAKVDAFAKILLRRPGPKWWPPSAWFPEWERVEESKP